MTINRELEEKLLLAGAGKRDTVTAKCMVVSDSVVRNVGAEHTDMMESFPGIKTEKLHRVTEKRDLGSPKTVGANDLRTTTNLGFLMEEVYALVATAKRKLPNCRLS